MFRFLSWLISCGLIVCSLELFGQNERAACYFSGTFDRRGEAGQLRVAKTTGVPWMDQAFTRELATLRLAYGLTPDFYIYDDSDGPNAFFTPSRIAAGTYDGTVAFGRTLMTEELEKTGDHNNFTIPAIMAHEFGHIVQYKFGENVPQVLKELEADYMAGWYMAGRDVASGWSMTSMLQNVKGFYSIGDYDFNSPAHHGTPAQRLAAFSAGAQLRGYTVTSAFQSASEYVRLLAAGGSSEFGQAPKNTNNALSTNKEPQREIERCLQRKISACMQDCTQNYGYPIQQCSGYFCAPHRGSNAKWDRECEP